MNHLLLKLPKWADAALGLFYPEVCQLCGANRATSATGFVCGDCQGSVRFIKPPFCDRCGLPFPGNIDTSFKCANCAKTKLEFSSARSAVIARDGVLEAIHRYKYHRALWFETFLAELLVRQATPELNREKWDFIVPVPLHPAKRREREFNQAERLALHLSRATLIPVHKTLLNRERPTQTQTLLSREEREENVRRAFVMRGRQRLKGERIVLLDDVFTTGATTNACARVLRAAGATEVCVWTVARGI